MACPPLSAAPPAGTTIDGRAITSFRDDASGYHATLFSNTTTSIVNPVPAHTLSGGQDRQAPALSPVTFSHHVENSGNVLDTYTIAVVNLGGDDFDLAVLTLYRDENRNGTIDAGEGIINSGEIVVLEPGERFYWLVGAQLPAATAGQTASVEMQVQSALGARLATVSDRVTVSTGALLQVSTQARPFNIKAGDAFNLSTQAGNPGQNPAQPLTIMVDGSPLLKVVVETMIPANTLLVKTNPLPSSAMLLYHIAGDADLSYRSTPPVDPRALDRIAAAFDRIDTGVSIQLDFDFRANTTVSGRSEFTAAARYFNSAAAVVEKSLSNIGAINFPRIAAGIRYFKDGSYSTARASASVGDSLYPLVDAAHCNRLPNMVENISLMLSTRQGSDQETFTLQETAPNSGVFRFMGNIPTVDGRNTATVPGNGLLEVRPDDEVQAQAQICGESIVLASLLIDPFGIVFDSRTGLAVAGATVRLIDVTGAGNGGNPGAPAVVFMSDGTTPSPNPVITAADGGYAFPLVTPSLYRLEVIPPLGYGFPSLTPPMLLAPDYTVEQPGSYGGDFSVDASTGPVRLDVPIDGSGAGELLLQKTAGRQTLQPGEFVDYRLDLKNNSTALIQAIQIEDVLPAGFVYIRGSTRLNSAAAPDPVIKTNGATMLVFNTNDLPAAGSQQLSYGLMGGSGARPGKAVNTARAQGAAPLPMTSNTASAAVTVLHDLFGDEGFIIGKVFLDCNGNRLQERGEPGIAGVHIIMENGNYAVTDAAGQYSFHGVSPRTHVIKLDSATLPVGGHAPEGEAALSNRHAGDPGSRFADIKSGELHKADFALQGCNARILRAVNVRSKQSGQNSGEAERRITQSLPLLVPAQQPPAPASAVLDGARIPEYRETDTPVHDMANDTADTADTPEVLMAKMNNQLDFANLKNGDVFAKQRINIQVKGMLGSRFVLSVNGFEIPGSRIGKRSVLPVNQLQLWEYVGIRLSPGENTLRIVQLDAFGNVRGLKGIYVIAAADVAKIHVDLDKQPVADGAVVGISVRISDDHDFPIHARIPVTLELDRGQWQSRDLDPARPGLQGFVENGKAVFLFQSPHEPGPALLRVSSGRIAIERHLDFLPHLRELVAVGVVEGVIQLKDPGVGKNTSPFERELQNLTRQWDQGKTGAGARAALYLKGRIKGEYLLRLRYDSDKTSRERMFRDIQPDKYYPLYGDASIKGFDAQSTGKLFVRVDKNKSYLLYGDFDTAMQAPPSETPDHELGNYRRNLNGIKYRYDDGHFSVDTFTSYESARLAIREIAALGVSGPYQLSVNAARENSERVEIIVRDRNQPAVILSRRQQQRFRDYHFNPYSGELMFTSPVASVDDNLNPVFIRLSYESDAGGDRFWSGGIAARYQDSRLSAGVHSVDEHDPGNRRTLHAADISMRITPRTHAGVQLADTRSPGSGHGLAHGLRLKHQGERFKGEIRYMKSDDGFDNPSAGFQKDRSELSAQARYLHDEKSAYQAEYIYSEDSRFGGERSGLQLSALYTLENGFKTELGLRQVREDSPADADTTAVTPLQFSSGRLRLSNQPSGLPSLNLFAEYESRFDGDGTRAAAGGEYTLGSLGGRVYAHHEFISSLGNPYTINGVQQRNLSVIGIDARMNRDTRAYGEYRIREVISSREAQAAMGLRRAWFPLDSLQLSAGVERIHRFNTGCGDDSTAVNLAMQYTADSRWKANGSLELRFAGDTDSYLNTLGFARRLSDGWSLLARNHYHQDRGQNGTLARRERLQLGLAYRKKQGHRWHGFGKYEYKLEQQNNVETFHRDVHLISSHGHYQPAAAWMWSGRVAAKWVRDQNPDNHNRSTAVLAGGRVLYSWNSRWDTGLAVSALRTRRPFTLRHGFGLEGGRVLAKNLWASVGYNVLGYNDDDLTAGEYTEKGFYVRLRYKFDESLIRAFGSQPLKFEAGARP